MVCLLIREVYEFSSNNPPHLFHILALLVSSTPGFPPSLIRLSIHVSYIVLCRDATSPVTEIAVLLQHSTVLS